MIDRFVPTSNYGERKDGKSPEYIILHYTVIKGTNEVCAFFCEGEREVSSHYILGEDGEIVQMVEEDLRAWHAGPSFWAGESDLNSRSIGIEIVNDGGSPFQDIQYERLIALIMEIRKRWDIPAQNVLGHSDIALGRKFDPGPWFDWPRLDKAGASEPPRAKIVSDEFLALAKSAGYDVSQREQDILLALRVRHGATPYFGALRNQDLDLLKKG